MKSDVVIIGAGHSGGMAAVLLRQNKFPGKITIIGNEEFYPYQRPPLSKEFISDCGNCTECTAHMIPFFA